MHVMCENNERYDCKTARWIQKQCNALNINDSKKKKINQFVLKAQTLNTFCIKIKELLILDGHNKITQYNVPSLAKSNLCNVCN